MGVQNRSIVFYEYTSFINKFNQRVLDHFRGVYLSALLYNEDKVLVTNEEVLPIIEVDENYNASSLHADFHWLIKVTCLYH